MFCLKCGGELPEYSKFCRFCGATQDAAGESIKTEAGDMVGFAFAHDEKVDELLRNATAFRDKKDWEAALKTMAEAKKAMLVSPVFYPTETWCKYPLYLQLAGRWKESLAEFNFLLDLNKRRTRHKIYKRCVVEKMKLAHSRMLKKRDG